MTRLTLLLVCLVCARARAETPPSAEYRNVSLGPILDFGFASSAVGQSLLGDLGGQFVGIQSFRGRRLLVQWDTLLAARGGILGNTLPYTTLAGARTVAWAEAGYRFLPARAVSPYLGGRLGGELAILTHPGTPIGQLDTLNDMAGTGGVVARGAVRVAAGASWIRGRHSFLVVVMFQEALRAPWGHTPGAAFAEGGVGVRYDLARRLSVSVDAVAGRSPESINASLDTAVHTTFAGVTADARVILPRNVWLGLSGGFGREFDHRVYRGAGTAYDTASAPSFNVALLVGVDLGHRRLR